MAHIVPYDPERPNKLGPTVNGAGPGYSDGYPEPEAATKNIRDYLSILRRQWWIFLGITLIATGITLYRVSQLPTRYRAANTIRLADRRDVVVNEPSAARSMIGRETDPLASQIQLLMSRSVALTAVELKGLRLKPPPGQPFPEEIDSVKVAGDTTTKALTLAFGPSSVVAISGASRAEALYGLPVSVEGITLTVRERPRVARLDLQVIPLEAAAAEAAGGLRAAPRQKTDIVDLSYVGDDPYQAKRMVNAMAEGFVAYSTFSAQQQSTRRRVFLENQLRQTEAQLSTATGAFTSYRSGQRVFSITTQGSAQEAGLLDIDVKRSQMDAEKKTYESLLAQAQSSPEETQSTLRVLISSPGMASNPVVARSYGQLTLAEQARDSLLTAGAAHTNPDVIAINSRISAYTGQLLAAVRSQIQALAAQLAALDNLRAAGQTKIAAAPAAAAIEGQLAQQVKSVQTVADQLQAELQKAKMAEAVATGQVEIVDLANNAGFPISNGVPRKIAMGILVGLLLGAVASVIIDGMNTSIRRRTDVEKLLKIPSLAVIPRFLPAGGGARFALPSRTGKSNGRKPGRPRPTLVAMADSASVGAEAFRTLRTNLMFSQAVQALRTVVVTSASPGEGKTTTVGNLGIAFAQQNLRVLMIDGDLRKSRLHTAFELSRAPGLTELLLGQIDQDEAVKPTSMPGLYVLTAGTSPPNPSEMLGGQKMRTLLQSLSEAFDLIILDTPPLLAASDGAILATLADGVVVVLRAGTTESGAAQQAMHQLNAVGARVVGAVLNDPDAKVSLYGAEYSYDYGPAGK